MGPRSEERPSLPWPVIAITTASLLLFGCSSSKDVYASDVTEAGGATEDASGDDDEANDTGTGTDGVDGSDGEDTPTDGTTDGTTDGNVAEAETLRILITGTDGVDAEGLSVAVEALRVLPDVDVRVFSASEDRSASGGSTEDDFDSGITTTADGYNAVSVEGFPVDAVRAGLDVMSDAPPHIVIAGINRGQIVGPIVQLSSTIAAAEAGAEQGIPSIAIAQTLSDDIDYTQGATVLVDWIEERRDGLLAGEVESRAIVLNVPNCESGELRGIIEVPIADDFEGRNMSEVDCEGDAPQPADDVDAMIFGYISQTEAP